MAGKIPKAPWANSTPEQDAAYALSIGMDIDFESEVAAQMGPMGRHKVRAEDATFLGTKESFNLQGTYLEDDYGVDEDYTNAVNRRYRKVAEQAQYPFEANTVYAVHARDANPRIWSHEFRHKYWVEDTEDENSEIKNRLFDIYRADSKDEYFDALLLYHNGPGKRMGLTLEESEKQVKKDLGWYQWAADFSRMEAAQSEEHGYAIPMKKDYTLNLPGERFDIYKWEKQEPKKYYYDKWQERRDKYHTLEGNKAYHKYLKEQEEWDAEIARHKEEIERLKKEIEDAQKEIEGFGKQ